MNNKIEFLKLERKSIINDYSSKEIPTNYIDLLAKDMNDLQYVIVKDIIVETSDTKSFILVPDFSKGTKSLALFKPGQYISIKMFINESYVTRAYSLSSSPKNAQEGFYRITIKRVENGLVSNIMFDDTKIGDSLTISNPTGVFTYNKIRDEENVIAIAGGCGVTPFISLAKSIIDGDENFNLTVFYSVKTFNDILFKKEIEIINKKSKKVKFIITLTREEKEGYLYGHINKDLIMPYLRDFNTIFMCGPKSLYRSMNEVLKDLNIPKKSVHYENFMISYKPLEFNTYELKVIMKDDTKIIECKSNETLLVAMEKAGIKAPSLCRVGTCGFCQSVLLEGKIKMVGASQVKALSNYNYIHPCVTYPESNIVLKLNI